MTLSVGDIAPDFSLPGNAGKTLSLSSLNGKKIVLYFYPKDMTPGCTIEANDFSAMKDAFTKAGAVVIGVSKDSVEKHDKFIAKHDLKIDLVADTEGEILDAYGVWGQKKLYGRTFLGITRATFLIDENGKVAKVWPKVKVKGHAEEVLEAVKAL